MSVELIHFNGAEKVLRTKKMLSTVNDTIEYLDQVLCGSQHHGELLKQALGETDWRRNSSDLTILEGRKYQYKGLLQGVAIDGNITVYEDLQPALFRLQLGFDKKLIDAGVILLNGARSEKSHIGESRSLLIREIALLQPTIHLPVCVALFDLSVPNIQPMEELKNAA